jgi:hypothetical protein
MPWVRKRRKFRERLIVFGVALMVNLVLVCIGVLYFLPDPPQSHKEQSYEKTNQESTEISIIDV